MKAARHTQSSKSPQRTERSAVDPRLLPFLDTLAEALATELLRDEAAVPAPRKSAKAK